MLPVAVTDPDGVRPGYARDPVASWPRYPSTVTENAQGLVQARPHTSSAFASQRGSISYLATMMSRALWTATLQLLTDNCRKSDTGTGRHVPAPDRWQ